MLLLFVIVAVVAVVVSSGSGRSGALLGENKMSTRCKRNFSSFHDTWLRVRIFRVCLRFCVLFCFVLRAFERWIDIAALWLVVAVDGNERCCACRCRCR